MSITREVKHTSVLAWVPTGHSNRFDFAGANDEDLQKAGYVKRANVTTSTEIREAEAWRKIDKWLDANTSDRSVCVTPDWTSGYWYAVPCIGNPFAGGATAVKLKTGNWLRSTKLEALEALATWCEANP